MVVVNADLVLRAGLIAAVAVLLYVVWTSQKADKDTFGDQYYEPADADWDEDYEYGDPGYEYEESEDGVGDEDYEAAVEDPADQDEGEIDGGDDYENDDFENDYENEEVAEEFPFETEEYEGFEDAGDDAADLADPTNDPTADPNAVDPYSLLL